MSTTGSEKAQIKEEDYQYVLGNDPGGTTGIAMMRYTENTPAELIYLSQLSQGMKGYVDFFEGSRPTDNVVIVSESFVNRPGIKSPDVTPLRIEGIQYAYWGDEVVYQTPDMKSLVPDQVLKDNNLWTPGKRHQMDALIHVLVYLRNQGHKPTLEALSGKAEEPIAEKGEAEKKTLPDIHQEPKEGQTPEEALADLEKVMKAFAEMFGGDEPERQDPPEQEQQEGPGEASNGGEGDEEGDGEMVDGGAGQEFEPEEPEITGQKRKHILNGSFAGFDED